MALEPMCGPYVCDFPDPDELWIQAWICPRCHTLYWRRRQSLMSKIWNSILCVTGQTYWEPLGKGGHYWSLNRWL